MPETVALHCEVPLTLIVDGVHSAWTAVTLETPWTVTDVLPDLLGSCTLVATTATEDALAGAVKAPLELIVPLLADQVTTELKLPVPETTAWHCEDPLVLILDGSHVTFTAVMLEGEGCTMMDVLLDLLASCVLVAVTVTEPAVPGAVNSPLESMEPLLADHVT